MGCVKFARKISGEFQMLRLVVADRDMGCAEVNQPCRVSVDNRTRIEVYQPPVAQGTKADLTSSCQERCCSQLGIAQCWTACSDRDEYHSIRRCRRQDKPSTASSALDDRLMHCK